MKIKLLQAMADRHGAHHAGAVIDVDDKKAEALIKGKYATPHRDAPKPAPKGAGKAAAPAGAKEAPEAGKEAGDEKGKNAR